ncbi:MAG: right-handed parallel beta-helix repeat-containing protein [Planctomycetota bacterium]
MPLKLDGPCIDAADGDAAPSTDMLGNGRIDISDVNNTGVGDPNYADMGSYEALADSDSDGMPDEWELDNGFDPLDSGDASEDADNDGLNNLGEYLNSTDPHDEDTDNDYMPDGWEVDNGLAPLTEDADNDPDEDGHTNLGEYLHGSDPQDDQSTPQSTTTITVPTEVGSIQGAVDLSISGDVIEILPGRYDESIDFDGNAVTVRSIDPNNWEIVESTMIDTNNPSVPVVTFDDGEDANCVLAGLTLARGKYGVSCSNSSSPTISRCIIEDHNSHGIYCSSGSPLITNNIICWNGDDGIYSSSSSPPTIKNSWLYDNENGIGFSSASSVGTVRNNTVVCHDSNGIYVNSGTAPAISNCILWDSGDDLANCSATYSCIEDGDAGQGNISSNPQFINDPNLDCRLDRTSPCKDKGDPNGNYDGEKDIEGDVRDANRVDMGADEICEVHNVTQDIWYRNIQDAIDDANSNDVIEAYEWTFYETVVFDGDALTVRSTDPNNWEVAECTIIDAGDEDANVVTFDSGEDANTILWGFTITGGKNGVFCANSSSPTIRNCLITDNNSTGILCESGAPLIVNNKIEQNNGEGIYSSSSTPPTVEYNWVYDNVTGIKFAGATSEAQVLNNTVADNQSAGIHKASGTDPNISSCIVWGHDSNDLIGCEAKYSCIEDPNDANGVGNFSDDPLFVNRSGYNLSGSCIRRRPRTCLLCQS